IASSSMCSGRGAAALCAAGLPGDVCAPTGMLNIRASAAASSGPAKADMRFLQYSFIRPSSVDRTFVPAVVKASSTPAAATGLRAADRAASISLQRVGVNGEKLEIERNLR